jgi:hypothetical protein
VLSAPFATVALQACFANALEFCGRSDSAIRDAVDGNAEAAVASECASAHDDVSLQSASDPSKSATINAPSPASHLAETRLADVQVPTPDDVSGVLGAVLGVSNATTWLETVYRRRFMHWK